MGGGDMSRAVRGPKSGASVRLASLRKTFGNVRAVDDISLDIPAGSFVAFLGPSGSGKTTTLNLLAGFITPDSGEILFDDAPISRTPTHQRGIGMVFQSYALFPHMTVFDNVAFPLKMRGERDRGRVRERVAEALAMVQLGGYEKRYPRQLSGGQQQRVAMARALVSHPRLLLMDEPLGALDKKLRDQMQIEIKNIHRRVGSTFVYVTHDQNEALTMSDFIVVMRDGAIAQAGTPQELYDSPANEFVADFLGGANLVRGRITGADAASQRIAFEDGQEVVVPLAGETLEPGAAASLFVRPEGVTLAQPDDERTRLHGEVSEIVFLGNSFRVIATVAGQGFSALVGRDEIGGLSLGDRVGFAWENERSRAFASEAGGT